MPMTKAGGCAGPNVSSPGDPPYVLGIGAKDVNSTKILRKPGYNASFDIFRRP